jgi:DNA-binding NtrC family response regulator
VPSRGGTIAEAEPSQAPRRARFCLHLTFSGHEPTARGRAIDLAGVRELVIGRGSPLAVQPTAPGAARLDVPDPTMSGDHVRVRIEADRKVTVADLGSRNGTRLGGERLGERAADDGDWFVAGRTAFVLRAASEPIAAEPFRIEGAPGLVTFVPALGAQYKVAADLAPSRVPVLIGGETGTGKEVLARAIHALSGRSGAFVGVNCAALPETLVESELFGYRRGAISDAREDRAGLVRSAHGGTLLLDEIGDMPLGSQAKLLRVLQEGEVLALGATSPVKVDVRVIGATQRNLQELVGKGTFRADLLGRLTGYSFTLPPLRDRLEDMGLLVQAFFDRHAGIEAASYKLTADAVVDLMQRPWVLNVRELERVIQAAVELARAGKREIGVEHLPPPAQAPPSPAEGEANRKDELVRLLTLYKGNVSAVARQMGKARMQIHRWMDEHGIDPDTFRPAKEGPGEESK